MSFYPKLSHLTETAAQAKVDGSIIREKNGHFEMGPHFWYSKIDFEEENICKSVLYKVSHFCPCHFHEHEN